MRKKVLDKTLKKIHSNENKLSAERDMTEKLRDKSKNLIVDKPHPRTLMQILETERNIAQLRTDHKDEIKALRIDGRRDFVPEPDALVFRMENFHSYYTNEATTVDRYGYEWKCTVTKHFAKYVIILSLMHGKFNKWSIGYGNQQEMRKQFKVGSESKMIGFFAPTEQPTQEVIIKLRPTYATRLEQMQDHINRLEKETVKFEALKKYLSDWESKITPSCG